MTCNRNAHLEEIRIPHGQTDLNEDKLDNICVCDPGWVGEECTEYTGECDPKCEHGCHGPLASDCHFCVEHAARNTEGFCECIENWSGDDCTIPGYTCHDSCHTCWGPEEW
jgi:hypothetical protein